VPDDAEQRATGSDGDGLLGRRTDAPHSTARTHADVPANRPIPDEAAVQSLASISVGDRRYLVIPGKVAIVEASKLRKAP
jgi:hypothetical protein